ncbi:hypothetical protein [Dyella psychrodurans]|uniref:hypothetical protein n=1 Tax=Dyella psychrodurans TaxID=1927960 RepID=UPI0011C01F63|nr:hypothetical protein [Dyella psychrodurans]
MKRSAFGLSLLVGIPLLIPAMGIAGSPMDQHQDAPTGIRDNLIKALMDGKFCAVFINKDAKDAQHLSVQPGSLYGVQYFHATNTWVAIGPTPHNPSFPYAHPWDAYSQVRNGLPPNKGTGLVYLIAEVFVIDEHGWIWDAVSNGYSGTRYDVNGRLYCGDDIYYPNPVPKPPSDSESKAAVRIIESTSH